LTMSIHSTYMPQSSFVESSGAVFQLVRDPNQAIYEFMLGDDFHDQ